MKVPFHPSTLIGLCLIALAGGCFDDGPDGRPATLSGQIVDLANNPVAGVQVLLEPAGISDAQTDSNGEYSMLIAADTEFDVVVEKAGYVSQRTTLPLVGPGGSRVRNFILEGSACGVTQTECGTGAIRTCNATGTEFVETACPTNETCVDANGRPECRGGGAGQICLNGLEPGDRLVFPPGQNQASFRVRNCGTIDLGPLVVEVVDGDTDPTNDYVSIISSDIQGLAKNVEVRVDATINRGNISDMDSETVQGDVEIRVRTAEASSVVVQVAKVVVQNDLGCAGQCMGAPNSIGGTCQVNDCQGCCGGTGSTMCLAQAGQSDSQCGSAGAMCMGCEPGYKCEAGACNCQIPVEYSPPLVDTTTCPVVGECIVTITDACAGTVVDDCRPCDCTPSNCSDGCCDSNQNCIRHGAGQRPGLCGSAGNLCAACGSGERCLEAPAMTGGFCRAPNCMNKCAGADDGARGTCPDNTGCASGCCDGITCLPSINSLCTPRIEGGRFGAVPGSVGLGTTRSDDQGFGIEKICNSTRTTCVTGGFETQP